MKLNYFKQVVRFLAFFFKEGKEKPLFKTGRWRNSIRQSPHAGKWLSFTCRINLWRNTVLLNWDCLMFLLLDEAGLYTERLYFSAWFIYYFHGPEEPLILSSPSSLFSLQSAGWEIVFRLWYHLPPCLWAVSLDRKHGSSLERLDTNTNLLPGFLT